MSLADLPEEMEIQVSCEQAFDFIENYDEGKLSELEQFTDMLGFEPDTVYLERGIGDPSYELELRPTDRASKIMLEEGDIEPYISGTVTHDVYRQLEEIK